MADIAVVVMPSVFDSGAAAGGAAVVVVATVAAGCVVVAIMLLKTHTNRTRCSTLLSFNGGK